MLQLSVLKMQVLDTNSDHNEVFVNGTWVAHIVKNASDHDYVEARIYIPANLLHHGIHLDGV